MKSRSTSIFRVLRALMVVFSVTINASAQADGSSAEGSGVPTWFIVFLIVGAGMAAAVYFWRKSTSGRDRPDYKYNSRYSNYYSNESYDLDNPYAGRELKQGAVEKSLNIEYKPKPSIVPAARKSRAAHLEENLDTKLFQEKMRKLQYAQLPINSFSELTPAKLYRPLELSNDKALLSAIEQAGEEFEEDESLRELAFRILAAFRTRNSVDAMVQIALYDLSSSLRAKAVSALTDFDHESVFESLLLACADPTREVRAAAARGLFRLNFDRADAWKRIIETNDDFRISQAARAATEAGIVVKSFDRLVHEDLKVAYEAFALVALLIRSGETNEVFNAITSHKDERVRFALIHVIKVQKDERTMAHLERLIMDISLPTDIADRVREAVRSFEPVMA